MSRKAGSLFLLFCILAVLSCRQTPALDGRYTAPSHTGSPPHPVLLLQEDGKGTWTYGSEDASFTWESRENEIWLHTKSGGVVVGKLRQDRSIDIDLPGIGSFHFVKADN